MKKLLNILPLLFCLFCLFCLAACSQKGGKTINIIHTNDIQGFYWPRLYSENQAKTTGGFAVLKNMLKTQPARTLLFDSGDTFSQTQEGQLGKIEAVVNLMNDIGYTAATLSVADLTLGWDTSAPALAKANFPIVVSNLETASGGLPPYIKEYILIEENGVKIAVLGLLSKTDFPTTQRNFNLRPKDEIATLRALIPQMQEKGANIIILLSSLGFEVDGNAARVDEKTIAEEFPEINLILGGNAAVSEEGAETIAKTLITRSPAMLAEVEKITLRLNKANQLLGHTYETILLDKNTYDEDEEIAKTVQALQDNVKRSSNRKLTELSADFNNFADRPSDIGAFVANCIKRWSGYNIGIINSDLFLSGWKKGPLTEADIYNSMPFNDRVMLFRMRGDELKNALEASLELKNNWPQLAGLEIVYDMSAPAGQRIKKMLYNGYPVGANLVYKIAASDHIIDGGLGHNEFINVVEFKNTDRTVMSVVRWCLSGNKETSMPKISTWAAR
ncbi:MAG: bifunctional metallophosphatase/5'-nucleotidase [Elusimicrobiota bacterium]|jgi:5'-nucleotidase|nr:bifunctional metallophosphatase/5'-nucleotidase [Elusimicrobiota bacterium]